MKTSPIVLSLCFILTACGGGTQGPAGAPGKSAYQIWLDQGNVGTEQDFLDSLVSNNDKPVDTPEDDSTVESGEYNNWHDQIMYEMSQDDSYHNFSEQIVEWPGHGTYNQYDYRKSGKDALSGDDLTTVWSYKEKELTLGNYIVFARQNVYNIDENYSRFPGFSAFIYNREGTGANIHIPSAGTTFTGGTLAYLWFGSQKYKFLTGNAVFTYDPNQPELALAFNDYYSITFKGNGIGGYNVKIDGTNSTGDPSYTLPTGEFESNKNAYYDPTSIKTTFLRKDNVEEGFGTYRTTFSDAYYNSGLIQGDIGLTGAFGGTKQ